MRGLVKAPALSTIASAVECTLGQVRPLRRRFQRECSLRILLFLQEKDNLIPAHARQSGGLQRRCGILPVHPDIRLPEAP